MILKSVLFFAFILSFALGLISWARQPDPYARYEMAFNEPGEASTRCMLIRPRLKGSWPVLVYLHYGENDPIKDGDILRKISDAGFIVVDAPLNQLDNNGFAKQLDRVISLLDARKLLEKRKCALIATGITPDFFYQLAERHLEKRIDLLACMPDEEADKDTFAEYAGKTEKKVNFPIMVLEKSGQPAVSQQKKLADWLRKGGNQVEFLSFKKAAGASGTLLYREMAEKISQKLAKVEAAEASGPLPRPVVQSAWVIFRPAIGFFLLFVAAAGMAQMRNVKGISMRKLAPYFACILGVAFGGALESRAGKKSADEFTLSVSDPGRIPAFINKWNLTGVQPKDVGEYLALADYDRRLLNWNFTETEYQEYILSPVLLAGVKSELEWRWKLWSFFYPKVTKANSKSEAASILVRDLREEIEVRDQGQDGFDFNRIWNNRVTSPAGFEPLYVAALRSVGIGARLNPQGAAEIFDEEKWLPAPRPLQLDIE